MNCVTAQRCLLACSLMLLSAVSNASDSYLMREDVRAYLDEISSAHDLDRDTLGGLFAGLSVQQDILDAISKPAERTLTWAQYRPIFLKQSRIDQGQAFMVEHADLLKRAQRTYGVPPSIITAIIGVETFYGRITGKYGVLESLATLAFDYPPRSTFFKQELTEFLMLSDVEGWPAAERLGSYAGAMGIPQFISSSYREYAVDFDGDDKRDLFNSLADVIGSVANYLSVHGWVEDAPIAERWNFTEPVPASVRALNRRSLSPTIAGDTVAQLGFSSEQLAIGTRDKRLLSVMPLQGQGGEEIWIGYRNFYVITRYNHSRLYAMAVLELAESIESSSDDSGV